MEKNKVLEKNRISKSSDLSLSLFLHLLIISLIFLFSHTKAKRVIVPYTVTILDSADLESSPKDLGTGISKLKENKSSEKDSIPLKKERADKESIDEILKERISALEAKKRIKNIAELRKKILDINSSVERKNYRDGSKDSAPIGSSKDYYSIVISKIKENWLYPENPDKDLLTIVIIKIKKDGNVTIDRIEKGSGNPLFDKSVLAAINRSNPLPPPGEDIELGIRFRQ